MMLVLYISCKNKVSIDIINVTKSGCAPGGSRILFTKNISK